MGTLPIYSHARCSAGDCKVGNIGLRKCISATSESRIDGPAQWANAKLVRYADDFVILARYQGDRLTGFVQRVIEERLHLKLNQDKTRIVNLREAGTQLDFLGYTFHHDRDLYGSDRRYLNMEPSKKTLATARQRLRELSAPRQNCKPVRQAIREVNAHLCG